MLTLFSQGQSGRLPYNYKAARSSRPLRGDSMPLDVGGDVLEIVQRVCDRALNVATARAKSSTHARRQGWHEGVARTDGEAPSWRGRQGPSAQAGAAEEKEAKKRPVWRVQLAAGSSSGAGAIQGRERQASRGASRRRRAARGDRRAGGGAGGRAVSCAVARGVDGHHEGPAGSSRRSPPRWASPPTR